MSPEQKMHDLITAQALEWFVTHRSGELSDAQRERFIDWLRASPEHVREYLSLTGLSEDMQNLAGRIAAPADVLISRARADINSVHSLFPADDAPAPAQLPGSTAHHSPRRFRAWAAAASVALIAGAIAVFSAWRVQDRHEYSTAHAEQHSWRMPDGSTVHLNSGSQISVHFDEQRREVELIKGQALFQVAKDAQRPFWVRTGDAAVKAVGTEFDVYRQPERTLVSVVEGRVAVWRRSQSAPVAQIDAGQQARISRESAVVSRKADDVRKTVAWLQRQVVFDHDPLSAAVEEFNRYSEVRIRIEAPSLSAAEVSGIFSAYDAEAFIRFLEHQPDMHVERTDREVIVTAVTAP
jgi:transmembrane sensor